MSETYRKKHEARQSADWLLDADGAPLGLVGPQGDLVQVPIIKTSPGGGVVLIGPNGEEITVGGGLTPDATGTLAGRSAHDAAAIGFVYLATDQTPQEYYIREGVSGWSAAIPAAGGAAPAPTPENSKELTFEMFGCTGVGNERDAITAALNYAATSGKPIVDYSGKTFSFDSSITITAPGKTIEIRGNVTLQGRGSAFLTIQGEMVEVGYLTTGVVKGASLITYSGTTLMQDDLIILWNSRQYSFSLHRPSYYDGEFAQVKRVNNETVSLYESSRTSYVGDINDKIFKLTPCRVEIHNVSFKSGATADNCLSIRYAANSKFFIKDVTTAGPAVAFSLDKCFKTTIRGGKFYTPYEPSTTTGYGIGISNSQRVLVEDVDAYGGRHGIATGGYGGSGSVPCRDVLIRRCNIDNDPQSNTHTADFHGNTESSYYEDCQISGWIMLSGRDIGIRGGRVTGRAESNKPILAFGELVGGRVTFSCEAVVHPLSPATWVIGPTGSAYMSFINEPCVIAVVDLKLTITASITKIMVVHLKGPHAHTWIIDGLTLLGSVSGLTTIASAYNDGGVDAKEINLTNISNRTIPLLTGLASSVGKLNRTDTTTGSTADGSYTRFSDGTMVCRHSFSGSSDISTAFLGGFKSPAFSWTYPVAFYAPPIVSITPSGGTSASAVLDGVSKASAAFYVTSFSAQGAAASREATLVATGRWRA